MRKSYLLLMFAVIFAGICSKLQADFPKFPLMERFTNASCGPCAEYNDRGYSAWVAANHNKLAIISYQTSWPSDKDPMYQFDTAVPNTRVSFYNATDANLLNSVPSVAFNGVLVGYIENEQFVSKPPNYQLDEIFAAEISKRTPMSITPKLEIVDGVANITVDVFSEEAMDNIRLQVLIVQSAVDHYNAPGSSGERIFPYVARYALPDMNGTNFTIEANETKTFPFKQALSSELTKQQRLYVVAFVEPSNSIKETKPHSIIQAGMSVDSVPMPKIMELTAGTTGKNILYSSNRIYAKAPKDSAMTHELTVTNNGEYEVVIDVIEPEIAGNWEIASSAIPAITPILAPGEQVKFTRKIKYIGETPSRLTSSITANVRVKDEYISQMEGDFIELPATIRATFVDVSSNTKHAYIYGIVMGDENTRNAFKGATYFNKEAANVLVDIPYFTLELFTTDILDSLEFLGMASASSWYWFEDIYRNNSVTINKLRSMKKTKLFLGIDGLTYNDSKYYADKADIGPAYKEADKFLEDMFGVNSKEELYCILTGRGTTFWVTELTGTGDEVSSKFPKLNINEERSVGTFLMAYFDTLSDNTTPVYTAMTNLTEPFHSVPVMAKYQNNDTKRFIVGFNFAALSIAPVSAPPIWIVASSIVDWMFDVNSSIENGETNLTTKSGILLNTLPNPVTSVSRVIVQNTNSLPVSAKVYLLDVSGKMVMNLFEGILEIGNNNIDLSNSNIVAGTYFVVAETATGKTYMSIAVSK